MGLQCKLPKSVQEDILNLKNKTLERLAATVIAGSSDHTTTVSTLSKGFTSTKLILFLLTFFGLLALILWLTSPSSSQEEEEGQEESRPVQRVMFSSSSFEDEDRLMEMMAGQQPSLLISYQQQQQQQQQQRGNSGNSSMVRRRSDRRGQQGKYQIDTIYESLAEVYEEKRSLTTSQSDPSVRETKEMLIRQTREELIRTIQQQQQLKQKQHQAAEKDTSPTGDMVDKILDDLILDDMETYAYNKDDRKPFYKQDSINNKTDSSTGSQNSLLSLYNVRHVNAIEDRFRNLDEVSSAIKDAGLEKGQLIFGIDFTISNLENGARTFGGRSLHHYEEGLKNPYQKVIEIMGKTLEVFDLDGRIPAFGFGDAETKDRKVFSFTPSGYCVGFQDVLDKYNDILKTITLSGPTNFAPLIKQAIKIVKETRQYHILVIVADGQVTNERQTRDAIVEASKHALSIIMVGVGDGPWDTMNEFDDSLPKRQFDNFQFVNYHEICEHCPENPDEAFALNALMEIPDQFKAIKELKLLDKLNK